MERKQGYEGKLQKELHALKQKKKEGNGKNMLPREQDHMLGCRESK